MATGPSIEPLARAHADLVSAYARTTADDEGSADLLAHLRIAQAITDLQHGDDGSQPAPADDAVIPEPPAVRRRVSALKSDLADASDRLGSDPLGRLYEVTRAEADRRADGQFYTPHRVATAAAEWALDGVSDPPAVLDPGAGSGTFLVAAAEVLRGRDIDAADAKLVAVDLNRIPLELARRRLRLLDGLDVPLTSINASFFDLDPDTPPPSGTAIDQAGETAPLGRFDAVIGNPPFVRGGELTDVDQYRSHLSAFGPAGQTPYLDGERAISRRSDAYVYFVTQATRFLRDGGRLAFVLPTKWLMSGYGEDLQAFLFDHYAVESVISLGTAFDDALVDTCLLLATRASDPGTRADASVRFVTGSTSDPVPIASGPDPAAATITRLQESLTAGKLDRFFSVPSWLVDLAATDGFVPLEAVAAISRGVMTGANRFFFVDRTDRERWAIADRFLTPAVKSLREIETPAYRATDIDRWLLDVAGYVSDREIDPTSAAVRAALDREGYDGLVAYLDHAEDEGWHEGRTCQQRSVWFDLGRLPAPDAFVPKLLRERLFVVRNRAGATPSNAIDCITADDGVDPDLLVAILNSSLVRAAMEVRGRNEAGMLQLMTYETAGLPIPDPREIPPADRGALLDAFEGLIEGDPDAQLVLDRTIVEAVDLDLDAETVRSTADRLRRERLDS